MAKKKTPIVPDAMENQEIHFRMTKLTENPDGSANMEIDCNEYTKGKLIELGVIALLKQHIEQEENKQNKPWWRGLI